MFCSLFLTLCVCVCVCVKKKVDSGPKADDFSLDGPGDLYWVREEARVDKEYVC